MSEIKNRPPDPPKPPPTEIPKAARPAPAAGEARAEIPKAARPAPAAAGEARAEHRARQQGARPDAPTAAKPDAPRAPREPMGLAVPQQANRDRIAHHMKLSERRGQERRGRQPETSRVDGLPQTPTARPDGRAETPTARPDGRAETPTARPDGRAETPTADEEKTNRLVRAANTAAAGLALVAALTGPPDTGAATNQGTPTKENPSSRKEQVAAPTSNDVPDDRSAVVHWRSEVEGEIMEGFVERKGKPDEEG